MNPELINEFNEWKDEQERENKSIKESLPFVQQLTHDIEKVDTISFYKNLNKILETFKNNSKKPDEIIGIWQCGPPEYQSMIVQLQISLILGILSASGVFEVKVKESELVLPNDPSIIGPCFGA